MGYTVNDILSNLVLSYTRDDGGGIPEVATRMGRFPLEHSRIHSGYIDENGKEKYAFFPNSLIRFLGANNMYLRLPQNHGHCDLDVCSVGTTDAITFVDADNELSRNPWTSYLPSDNGHKEAQENLVEKPTERIPLEKDESKYQIDWDRLNEHNQDYSKSMRQPKIHLHSRIHGKNLEFLNYITRFSTITENEKNVTDKIESGIEKISSILKGQGSRAWYKRVNQINDIFGDNYHGLYSYIQNGLMVGSITREYAARTTSYLKEIMDESMTKNRSFKRALQGSKWERTAQNNMYLLDDLIDDNHLDNVEETDRSHISESKLEMGVFTELLVNELNGMDFGSESDNLDASPNIYRLERKHKPQKPHKISLFEKIGKIAASFLY
jgi:hypothetical protein